MTCLSFIKPAGSVGDSTAEDSNLPVDHLTARAANSLPPLDTGLEIEHSAHVLVKSLMQAPQVLQSEVAQLARPRLRQRDRPP